MNIKILFTLVFVGILAMPSSTLALPIPITGDVIFACMGQSNMSGRATYTTGSQFPADTYQLNQSGVVETVEGNNNLEYLDSNNTRITPCLDFAIKFHASNTDATLIFMPLAEGGTGFASNDWNPGDRLYASSTNRLNTLLASYPTATFGGFLWHQGENDDNNATFESQLDTMITSLRGDVDRADATTPFILGSFSSSFYADDVSRIAVKDSVEDTPNRIPYTGVAPANDLSLFDEFHFDEASTRTLGQRMYEEWAEVYTSIPETPESNIQNVIISNVDISL